MTMEEHEFIQTRLKQEKRVRERLDKIEPIVEAEGGCVLIDFNNDGGPVYRLSIDRQFLFGMRVVLRSLIIDSDRGSL